MNLTVTPSIEFDEENIDIEKLNLMATPKVTIDDGVIDQSQLDASGNYFEPLMVTFASDVSNEWVFRDDFPLQHGETSTHAGETTTITFPAEDYNGGRFLFIALNHINTGTLEVTADYIYSISGGGTFSPAATGFYVMSGMFLWSTSTTVFATISPKFVQ